MPDASQLVPLDIVQGATVVQEITFTNPDGYPVPLNGYTALMNFRTTVWDTGTPIITLSTSDGSISIDAVNGIITFVIPSSITQTLTDGQTMDYNLFIYSPTGIVTPLLAGTAYVQGSTI